jgi:cell division protein FtsB
LLLFLEIIGDNPTKPRVPSLVLAAILILMGFQLWIFGLAADLIAVNRKILEDVQLRVRRNQQS